MKLLFVLMLAVSSFTVFAGEVATTDGSAIMCQTEAAKSVASSDQGDEAVESSAVSE